MVRSKETYNYYEAKKVCARMNKGLKEALGKKRFVKCKVVQAKKKIKG